MLLYLVTIPNVLERIFNLCFACKVSVSLPFPFSHTYTHIYVFCMCIYYHILNFSFCSTLLCLLIFLSVWSFFFFFFAVYIDVLKSPSWLGIVLSVWAAITGYHRLGGLNNKHLFLMVLEIEKSRSRFWKRFRVWRYPSCFADDYLHCISHGEETERN